MQTTDIPVPTAEVKAGRAEQLASYLAVLSRHDWSFEHADDYTVWHAGKTAYDALRVAQPLIDPDHVFWNAHAPEHFRVHIVTPLVPAPGAAS